MSIRCLSLPFSPLPWKNPAAIGNKILISKALNMLSLSSHHSFDAREVAANRKVRSLGKVMVSAEKDLLRRDAEHTDFDYGVVSLHHVGILCENLERSLAFYKDILGLQINEARPHDKLPYRGAWLWVGSEMIHLMELPNPDPLTGRPEHGGRDRHSCISIKNVMKLKAIFDEAGINYTLSRSGRPAIFARDPDGNALEFTQVD